MLPELSALAAALCWSFGGLIAAAPARALGGVIFTRVRMLLVFIMLCAGTLYTGGWGGLSLDQSLILITSGFTGILLGDVALFTTLGRLGPRRTAILFACNAPMTALLAWLFLDEVLELHVLIGCLTITAGVICAVALGSDRHNSHHWEQVRGPLVTGILLGLLAALGQSVGTLIAKPVMSSGVDPVAASALRVGTAAFGLQALRLLPVSLWSKTVTLTPQLLIPIIASGFLGMGLGMTLLLYALAEGEAGMVATLSSTTPVLVLPLIWIKTGRSPSIGAWLGALLVITGTALII